MYLCLRLTLMDGSHSSSESLFSQAAPLASSSHLTADSFLSHNCCITAAHSVITQVLPFSKSFFFLFFSVKSQGTIYIFFFFILLHCNIYLTAVGTTPGSSLSNKKIASKTH